MLKDVAKQGLDRGKSRQKLDDPLPRHMDKKKAAIMVTGDSASYTMKGRLQTRRDCRSQARLQHSEIQTNSIHSHTHHCLERACMPTTAKRPKALVHHLLALPPRAVHELGHREPAQNERRHRNDACASAKKCKGGLQDSVRYNGHWIAKRTPEK